MGRAKKVVLAYSGGVDTSVCIPYLKQEWGVEDVITFAADLGQGDELEPIRQKALDAGASQSLVGDLIEPFIKDFAFPAIRANALYEGRYPLSTALARPLIAKRLVEVAREVGADAVAHGCTGKGNDQVRFDVAIAALAPDLKVLTPAREWGMSREETIAYGERFGLPAPVSKKSPYSIDLNLLGRSIEAGPLEDPMVAPPEEVFAMTRSVEAAPDASEEIEIAFEAGNPVAINGQQLDPVALIREANRLAGTHGIGRLDMIENRVVGIKSREIYETPWPFAVDPGPPGTGKPDPGRRCAAQQAAVGNAVGRSRLPGPLVWPSQGCSGRLHGPHPDHRQWCRSSPAAQRNGHGHRPRFSRQQPVRPRNGVLRQ